MLVKFLISAGALLVTDFILEGITIDGIFVVLIATALWGAINYFIKPVLQFLAIPISLATLGIFYFVINGLLFWSMSAILKGFHVDGILAGILGAFFTSLFIWIGEKIFIKED